MTAAIERSPTLASASAPGETRAADAYRAALAPEWNDEEGV